MGIDARMFVKIKGEVNDETLKRWSYIFGSAFKDRLFLGYEANVFHAPLERIDSIEQDGPTIYPRDNETFLYVPLGGRYYGPGYERGDLMTYIGVAEFLERLTGGDVYYGGDSSGVEAILFDKKTRDEFVAHFIEFSHDPYNQAFEKPEDLIDAPECPICHVRMIRNGWGANYALYTCSGCGWMQMRKNGLIRNGFHLQT